VNSDASYSRHILCICSSPAQDNGLAAALCLFRQRLADASAIATQLLSEQLTSQANTRRRSAASSGRPSSAAGGGSGRRPGSATVAASGAAVSAAAAAARNRLSSPRALAAALGADGPPSMHEVAAYAAYLGIDPEQVDKTLEHLANDAVSNPTDVSFLMQWLVVAIVRPSCTS
jgi:hypothetical protein